QCGDGGLVDRLDKGSWHAEPEGHHSERTGELCIFANPDDSQLRAAAGAPLTGIHRHRWDALDRAKTEPARLRFKSRSRSRPKQYAEGYAELLHLRHGGRQSGDGVVWALLEGHQGIEQWDRHGGTHEQATAQPVLDPRTIKGGVQDLE